MGYLKRFYEEHHFEEMVPYEPAEMEESISPFANKLAAATISRDKTRALIYYGEMDGMSTPLAGLCDGKVIINYTKCGKKPQKSANSSQDCSFLEVRKQI